MKVAASRKRSIVRRMIGLSNARASRFQHSRPAFAQSIARPEIQIGFVRPTPDALSFDQTVISHLLQIVFDACR